MNVIIDTDVALDDWMAISYLVMSPDVNVLGVTTTGVGAAYLTPGTRNALDLLATLGRADVPVAAGTSAALRYSNVYPTAFRQTVNEAYYVPLTQNPNPPKSNAVEFIASTVTDNPGVDILSIGGGTNLGTLLSQQPDIAARIGSVVIMGGAINDPPGSTSPVAGNVSSFNPDYSNTVAEWNMFVDPKGAELMLTSGLDVTLVTLNACNEVPLTSAFYRELQAIVVAGGATPAATVIYAALTSQLSTVQQGQYFFWDPLTAVLLTDPAMADYLVTPVKVHQDLDLEDDRSGQTLIADEGSPVRVAMTVPRPQAVRERFLAVISGADRPDDH